MFWFGDLNFRLSGEEPPEDILQLVKADKLNDLMKKDQLLMAMCEGKAFSELVERAPKFPPTFKFHPKTHDYDMKRRPAWCDRILYKAKSKTHNNVTLELEQLSYKSHPNYTISDHRPVTSEFKLKVSLVTSFFEDIKFNILRLVKSPIITALIFIDSIMKLLIFLNSTLKPT